MLINQSNGLSVTVESSRFAGEILFDIRLIEDHYKHSFSVDPTSKKLYQNISVKDAKAIRKALKKAIKELEGE